MKQEDKDALILAAALERLNKFRLPRVSSLKDKVDRGEALDHFDLDFLRRILDDARQIKPFVDRNPDYLDVWISGVALSEQNIAKNNDN